jgi:hypothetical protein
MALYEYIYSIHDDFIINHKVDITILQLEIEDSTIITKELHHIDANVDDDECIIYFNEELSDPEEEELNTIVATHTGEYSTGTQPPDFGEGGGPGDIIFIFGDDPGDYYVKFKNSYWTVCNQFIFRGTNKLGTPSGVKVILKGEGKIRLYDKTHCRTIFEWTNYNVNDWTIFSQTSNMVWPQEESIFEVQGEKDSSYAYLSCFMICFSGTVVDNIP